jgi:hypothetical protein
VIILGVILLIIGFVAKTAIIWRIGIIVVVVGAILALLGMTGHAVRGRRHFPGREPRRTWAGQRLPATATAGARRSDGNGRRAQAAVRLPGRMLREVLAQAA